MLVRHVIARAYVDPAGWVTDPLQAHHAIVVAGRIADLAGPIDAQTHLNADFPEHRLDWCLIVERCAPGAAVLVDEAGPLRAWVGPEHRLRRGAVDLTARRVAWIAACGGRKGR